MSAYLERLALRLVGTPVAIVRPRLPARFEAWATSAAERPGPWGDGDRDAGPLPNTPADATAGAGSHLAYADGQSGDPTAAAQRLPRPPAQPGAGAAAVARASGRLDDDVAAAGDGSTKAAAGTAAAGAATGPGPAPHHSGPAGRHGPAAAGAAPATSGPDAPAAAAADTARRHTSRPGEQAVRARQTLAGTPNLFDEASSQPGHGRGGVVPGAVAGLAAGSLRGSGPSAATDSAPARPSPGHAAVPSPAWPGSAHGALPSDAAPVVEVTIGSVELRLPASAASSRATVLRPQPTAPAPRLSLRDYLRRRGEGSGGPAR